MTIPDNTTIEFPDGVSTADADRLAAEMMAGPELFAALVRLLQEENPYCSGPYSCECGPFSNGRDIGDGECAHIQAHRALQAARHRTTG